MQPFRGEVLCPNGGFDTIPPSTIESLIANEYDDGAFSSMDTLPLIFDLLIFTLLALMVRSQFTVFASITVFAAVIVHGPV